MDNLSKHEQAVVAEIRTLIDEIEPRRRWLSSLDVVLVASLALVSVAAFRLFY